MVKRELSIRTFISRLGSALQEENEMRVSLAFIAAIMIARLALPVQAAAPVRGAVHGTATVGTGVVRGAGQAGRGIVRGTYTVARSTGRGVRCIVTLGTRC